MIMNRLHALILVGGLAATAQAQTTFDSYDTTTQGNWIGVYGAAGYTLNDYYRVSPDIVPPQQNLNNQPIDAAFDAVSLPTYVSGYAYSASAKGHLWQSGTTDLRALQDPANSGGPRNAATAYDGAGYTLTLTLSEAKQFTLGVYALDWDSTTRDTTVTVGGAPAQVDNTANPAQGTDDNVFNKGTWLLFDVDALAGPLTINVANNNPASNAVISGLTFDPVPEPGSMALLGCAALGLLGRRRAR